MKAFRVVVDGKAMGDLGVADFSNASVTVTFARGCKTGLFDCSLHIGGLTRSDEDGVSRHARWACPSIQEGSRIEVEIVDSENCEPPTRIYRSDREFQEPAFTEEEMRNMRYEGYLKLKKEFEP